MARPFYSPGVPDDLAGVTVNLTTEVMVNPRTGDFDLSQVNWVGYRGTVPGGDFVEEQFPVGGDTVAADAVVAAQVLPRVRALFLGVQPDVVDPDADAKNARRSKVK